MRNVHHLALSISLRLRNGECRQSLKTSFLTMLQNPSARHMEYFRTDLMWMFLGDYMMRTFFRDYTVRRGNACTGKKKLYHLTPLQNVDSVLSCGLKPSKRFVYLTNDPDTYRIEFLPWKGRQLGSVNEYILVEVDLRRLVQHQPVFHTQFDIEFVTGAIDPQYLSVLSEQEKDS